MPTVIWSIPMFPNCVSVLRCTPTPCGSRVVDATILNVPEPSPSRMDTSSSSTSSWPGYRGKGCRLACSPRAHGTSRMGEHLAQQSSPISKFARRRYVRSSSPAQTWCTLGRPSSGWLRLQILPPGKDAPSSPSGSSLRPGLVHNPQRS